MRFLDQALAIAAPFSDLARVPTIEKGAADADLTRLPARQGYADLVQVVNKPEGTAWTCAVRGDEGWMWYALKDPKVLRSTLFWIENRGRHGSPWNGRNNCLGLEDVCGFFADGLVPSTQDNALTKQGVRTAIELDATITRPNAASISSSRERKVARSRCARLAQARTTRSSPRGCPARPGRPRRSRRGPSRRIAREPPRAPWPAGDRRGDQRAARCEIVDHFRSICKPAASDELRKAHANLQQSEET